MTKTKFKTELHANGEHFQAILQMVANHNSGLANIDLLTISGYVKAKAAQYPTISDGRQVVIWDNKNDTLHISSEEGKPPYLSITECTYDELGEIGTPAENDLEVLEQVEDVVNISQQGSQC